MTCAHHHHHQHTSSRLGLTICLNLAITFAQIAGGYFSNSLALWSDALHNLNDVVSLVVSYIAIRLAMRAPTSVQTFGYKRAEIIAALLNTTALVGIAVLLGHEAILRMSSPQPVQPFAVIALAALGIVVNGYSMMLLRKEATNSLNVKAAYLHLFSDMLTSVAVFVGGVVMYFFKIYWIDSLLSVLIAIYITASSVGILIHTVKVIMHFTPDDLNLKDIALAIRRIEHVANVHHIHVWCLTDQEVHFEAHVDFSADLPLSAVSKTLAQIRTVLQTQFNIQHTVLQPEIGVTDSKQLVVTE